MRLTFRFLLATLLVGASTLLAAPEEGKPAPSFDVPATSVSTVLPDSKAKTLSLKDFEGKKNVVLFFYPKALTKGCTIESCGFRDKVADFAKLDTVIIGASTDTVELQQKFTDKEKLNFPLLADHAKKVAEAYGVLNPNGIAKRHTFVIDKKGVLRKVYEKVSPGTHPDEVLTFVKEKLSK